jgi:transcriptional regulator with XRE-family HTH domain
MSAETLAAEVGCSTRSIERLEAGETLSASLLERVLDYLDADLSVVTDYERAEEQP